MPPDLKIATNAEAVDIMWLLAILQRSYWGKHYTLGSLFRATDHSICFSAFIGSEQVGFARIVSDLALTSMLNDVIVDEKWRGKGIGTALLNAVFNHPAVKPTICLLQTRPENYDRYQKFGFVPVGSMMKRDPQ